MGITRIVGEGFYISGRKDVATNVEVKRDFRKLEDMQPGEKWTRLDGQERVVPERRPVIAEKTVVGRKEETRMDGRVIAVPVYEKS